MTECRLHIQYMAKLFSWPYHSNSNEYFIVSMPLRGKGLPSPPRPSYEQFIFSRPNFYADSESEVRFLVKIECTGQGVYFVVRVYDMI